MFFSWWWWWLWGGGLLEVKGWIRRRGKVQVSSLNSPCWNCNSKICIYCQIFPRRPPWGQQYVAEVKRWEWCISGSAKIAWPLWRGGRSMAVSRSLISGIFKTSRTVHQYKEVSIQFISVLFREYHNTGGDPAWRTLLVATFLRQGLTVARSTMLTILSPIILAFPADVVRGSSRIPISGAGTRDEPQITSVGEATIIHSSPHTHFWISYFYSNALGNLQSSQELLKTIHLYKV